MSHNQNGHGYGPPNRNNAAKKTVMGWEPSGPDTDPDFADTKYWERPPQAYEELRRQAATRNIAPRENPVRNRAPHAYQNPGLAPTVQADPGGPNDPRMAHSPAQPGQPSNYGPPAPRPHPRGSAAPPPQGPGYGPQNLGPLPGVAPFQGGNQAMGSGPIGRMPQPGYGPPAQPRPPQGYGPPPAQFQPPTPQNAYSDGPQRGRPMVTPSMNVGPQLGYGPQLAYGAAVMSPSYGQGQAQPMAQPPAQFPDGTSEEQRRRNIPHADATAGQKPRLRFIRLTYLHLFAAMALFAGLEYLFLRTSVGDPVINLVLWPMAKFGGRAGWGIILAAFVAGSYLFDLWARSDTSKAMQYLGLGMYVLLEALIFIPLLLLAEVKAAEYAAKYGSEAHFIRDAAIITLAVFGGLTASVLLTKKDFSFLRGGLFAGSAIAASLIVMSLLWGFQLGMVFSAAMILLAAGYILYYTSQVLAYYRPSQYVAASLTLFAAVALMFWYVLRLLMKLRQ